MANITEEQHQWHTKTILYGNKYFEREKKKKKHTTNDKYCAYV